MRIAYISMMITLEDGQVVAGMISRSQSLRWLSDQAHQDSCAEPMAAMQAILNSNDILLPEGSVDHMFARSPVEGA